MTDTSLSTLKLESALGALAVLERADQAALAALLGQELSSRELAGLARHLAVSEERGQFILAPDAAAEILVALEQDDLPRYRLLHERAITFLAERLRARDETVEPTLMAVFVRLANQLLTADPQPLFELVDVIQKLPLTNPASRQRCVYFQAVALRNAERYGEALAVSDALLQEPDLDPWVRGRTLNSRAICYRLVGRLGEALADYRVSLGLFRQLGHRLGEGFVLINMGTVTYELQDYDEAKVYLHQAAAIFEEIGSSQWLASVHNELGLVHRDQGHWPEALAYFEKYVAQRRAEEAHDRVGRGLNNIGEVLLFQGRLEEACAVLEEVLEKMTTRVYRVDTHLNLGLAYQATGNLAQAQAAFQEAMDLALVIGRRDILPHVHYRLGDVWYRLGDGAAALDRFRAGAEVIEAMRSPLHDEELKISLLGRWQQVYEALVLHCLAQGRKTEAFEWAERARARAFAEALLAKQLSSESPQEGDEREAQASQPSVAAVDEVQAGLPADGALLCYFTTGVLDRDVPLLKAIPGDNPLREHLLTPARTLLFVVTRQRLAVHDCPLDPNLFATASPRRYDPLRFLAPTVRQRLYAALVGIAPEALGARQLYVIPHGPLHYVPFGALLYQPEEPSSQAREMDLTYAPSATLLVRHGLVPAPHLPPGRSCLAIGYNGVWNGRVLRYTEPEANMVAHLTGGQVWVGPYPKKDRLRGMAAHQRWLHIACHGWFNHDQPLESYLETGLGERLAALEVIQDWRLQAELVVLSACQTGVSRILRGDEPMGLIRAFLSAGARAVLVSRWAVEDLPTFLLMYRFYSELQDEMDLDLSAALHLAQRWLRRLTVAQAREVLATLPAEGEGAHAPDRLANLPSDTRPFSHPRHWAAFTLVGGAKER
jgi:CHAT domain-containing protein/tetratricopeptide (TPR) repeat protein